MALGNSFTVMAIALAETLIALGTTIERYREPEKGWAPFTDAVCLQPDVVAIVGVGVIKAFPYPSRFGIGMDIPQGIQHSPVIFGMDWR